MRPLCLCNAQCVSVFATRLDVAFGLSVKQIAINLSWHLHCECSQVDAAEMIVKCVEPEENRMSKVLA